MVTGQSTSFALSPYRPAKDTSTFDGGYRFVVRRVEREQPAVEDVQMWRWDHFDTPRDERGNWWHGGDAALCDTIDRISATPPHAQEAA